MSIKKVAVESEGCSKCHTASVCLINVQSLPTHVFLR